MAPDETLSDAQVEGESHYSIHGIVTSSTLSGQ